MSNSESHIHIPAYCQSCDIWFRSGIATPANFRNVTMVNVSSACPECTQPAGVPDGVFGSVEDLVAKIVNQGFPASKILALQDTLQRLRRERASVDAAKQEMYRTDPLLGQWFEGMVKPDSPIAFWAMVSALLFALSMINQCNHEGKEPDVNIILEQTVEGLPADRQ